MLVPTIGVEVHVELKSKTKVFSNSINSFSENANTYVNVVDLGYPGVLPTLNKEVINMALKAALACNCKINQTIHFDRKNYFYPDLPKGYQITQKDTPIGYDGYLEIEIDGIKKKIEIERIHIEEDTCKSIHNINGTLLNFNRAGVPLIEIVTKPVITSGEEAVLYLEKLRETLLYLGVSDVKIEEGSMRCDANVSLKEEDSLNLGTKTEIKNIGSITNVMLSINYEIKRQKEILENNGKIIEETRRFDDKTGKTILMRVKETGNDYRYFPEPDIPYVNIDDNWLSSVKDNLPLLPEQIKEKYVNFKINDKNLKTLMANYDINLFLINIIDKVNPLISANLLTGDVISYMNKNNLKWKDIKLTEENFMKLVDFLDKEKISSKQAKEILPILLEKEESVESIIKSLGLEQISDENVLRPIIDDVIFSNPNSVIDYKEGKDRAIKFLMGQIMKETKGQANPKLVSEMLINTLNQI